MTLVTERPIRASSEHDAEALIREAKRRARRRRFGVFFAVLALAGGLIAAISAGGSGHRSRGASNRNAPRPHPIDLGAASWSTASEFQADLSAGPVELPGTSFAYAIEVKSNSPTSRTGRLVRINLVNGAVTRGPEVSNAENIFVLGNSVALLTLPRPADARADRDHSSSFDLQMVVGHSTKLGASRDLRLLDSGNQVVAQSGPLVHGNEFWIATGDTAYVLNARTGTIARQFVLGGEIGSITVAPNGERLYVALNELMAHPTTPNPTVIQELDVKSERVLQRSSLRGAELGWATLNAVTNGVWASYRGGMNGTAVLLRARDLTSASPTNDLRTPEAQVPVAGESVGDGIAQTPLGQSMWLTSALGSSCVIPDSGQLLGGTAFVKDASGSLRSWMPFATVNGVLYATADVPTSGATRILAVRSPTSCR